ncbi:MAG: B12-binding domain-containing radical SAM protein [Bacteroidales bacterium]|nr:B12-binding domain-containing radical SAM protein [Bacteroidales bacterium]
MLRKITLIKPNIYSSRSKGALPPLFAAALAAHTPEDIHLKLYDDRIESIPFDEPTDLAAIHIDTFSALRAYRIAGEYRKRGVKVIAGGFHATLCPDETLQHVDSIITGDAEEQWPALLEDARHNRLKTRYEQKGFIKPERIRFKRDLFLGKKYGPVEMVQWGRGCTYDCEFCSVKSFYGNGQIWRPIEDVVEEVAGLKKKIVFFADDNLFHNRSGLVRFLKEIKPLRIKWVCQVSVTIAQDPELLGLMADSGCFIVLIGIESFNASNLKLMNKSWNISRLGIQEAVNIIRSFGIFIFGTFIFGYDHDTPDSFQYAVEFASRNNFFLANFNPLYPLPGSRLYQRYKKDNRLLDNWWLREDYYYGKSMFEPLGMSSGVLEKKVYEAKLQFNSWKSILNRAGGLMKSGVPLEKLALFFYSNYINRSEIIHKQGKTLGV